MPISSVPNGWVEDDEFEWEPKSSQKYTGAEGGPAIGPSLAIKDKVLSSDWKVLGLTKLFLFFFPLALIRSIAEATQKYAREDWVVPSIRSTPPADGEDEDE